MEFNIERPPNVSKLKSILISPWFMVTISVIITSIGLTLDVFKVYGEHWFDRSGAVLIIFALLCTAVRERVMQPLNQAISDVRTFKYIHQAQYKLFELSPEGLKPELKIWLDGLIAKDSKLQKIAFVESKKYHLTELLIASVGTFIWGFGDMIVKKIPICTLFIS